MTNKLSIRTGNRILSKTRLHSGDRTVTTYRIFGIRVYGTTGTARTADEVRAYFA